MFISSARIAKITINVWHIYDSSSKSSSPTDVQSELGMVIEYVQDGFEMHPRWNRDTCQALLISLIDPMIDQKNARIGSLFGVENR